MTSAPSKPHGDLPPDDAHPRAATAPGRDRFVPPPSLRLATAVRLGRATGTLSKTLGLGGGSTIGGRVMRRLAPRSLADLAIGRRTVLVTGTNGKSTTTRLLVAALGGDVCTNAQGANMPAGLVAALAASDAPTAVLETDELHLPAVLRDTKPRAVVTLNLSRDQLDRMHEISRVTASWREAFTDHPTTVVANSMDPQTVAPALAGRPVWVRAATPWTRDATVCPACGGLLHTEAGHWRCTSCGLAEPPADVAAEGDRVRLPDGTTLPLRLALPGAANQGNAAFAVAAAMLLGVPPRVALDRIAQVTAVGDRYTKVRIAGRDARLLLAKNPAGWTATFDMLDLRNPVAVGVNARVADGHDTSWLWDVPFEALAGAPVGVFGDRAADIALRLHYAGIEAVRAATIDELLPQLPPGVVTVVANYTAFREVTAHAR